jgi:hypothetical protein
VGHWKFGLVLLRAWGTQLKSAKNETEFACLLGEKSAFYCETFLLKYSTAFLLNALQFFFKWPWKMNLLVHSEKSS